MNIQSITIDPLLKGAEVQKITGLSRSTIYRMIGEGRFPRPKRLGATNIAWRASAIKEWIDALPDVEDTP